MDGSNKVVVEGRTARLGDNALARTMCPSVFVKTGLDRGRMTFKLTCDDQWVCVNWGSGPVDTHAVYNMCGVHTYTIVSFVA